MSLKPNREALRLREIPQNTVVHTPTEAEAKELLAILHENGWVVREPLDYVISEAKGISIYPKPHWGWWEDINNAKLKGETILTLAEFKEKYATNEDDFTKSEEEKPQPKFRLGERIRIVSSGEDDFINMITEDDCYELLEHRGKYIESDLEPYTEPRTRDEAKELNLVELLQGHEGESIFLTTMGEVLVEKVSEEHLFFRLPSTEPGWRLNANGKMSENGVVITYPSRALWEQYPLAAAKAWSEWQKAQKKYHIEVIVNNHDNEGDLTDCAYVSGDIAFRTPADRDKCIEVIDAFLSQIQQSKSVASLCEEIKAIIEKYSKK